MSQKYVGKTCPYCKNIITEGDTIAVCGVCDMPHHLSCWQDNRGCTTFGCTGTIREIIKKDSTSALNENCDDEVIDTQNLYECNELVFMSGVPIALEKVVIISRGSEETIYAVCQFRCISDVEVKAALVELICQDVWGNVVGEPITYQYLDLKAKKNSVFGEAHLIDITDKTTRKIQVRVKKVLFSDDTIAIGEGVSFVIPAPEGLEDFLGSKDLFEEYVRETTKKARFVFTRAYGYWRCTCGALNEDSQNSCCKCGCTVEQLENALSVDNLNENLLKFREQEQALEKKRHEEEEERKRQAEEKDREAQEKIENERKVIEQAAQKKRRKRMMAIAAAILAVVIVVLIYFENTYWAPNRRYIEAINALNNKQYDTAYNIFISLGDFKDSKEQSQKVRYEQANDLLWARHYDKAYPIYKSLGGYADSDDKVKECIYSWVDFIINCGSTMEAKSFAEVISLEQEHYGTVYNKVLSELNERTNKDGTYWLSTARAEAMRILLEELPTSYELSGKLREFLLQQEKTGGYKAFYQDNEQLLRQIYYVPFVRKYIEASLDSFLEGYWVGSGYYFQIYRTDEGTFRSSYDLPTVSQPSGTKYYDIEQSIYYWDDKSGKHLTKVFRFDIVNYDTIRIYCYKNNRSYTLYR